MIYFGSIEKFYQKHKTKLRLLMALDKPKEHAQLEYCFTDLNGINYNRYAKNTAIPVERYGKIMEYQMWMSSGLSSAELDKLIDAAEKAIGDGIKKDTKNISKVGAILYQMRERKNMVIHSELILNFVAVQVIREDENPEKFDAEIHQQKVEQFKKEIAAGNSHAFFFNLGLSKLNSLYDMSPSEWERYWQESQAELKVTQEWLTKLTSEKKSSTGAKAGKENL